MKKLALLLALIVSTGVQAEVYRWVDENGVTVYSATPPPAGDAETVKTAPPPKTGTETQSQLDAEMQKLEDYREDRELAGEKEQEEEQKKQFGDTNCRNAKSNLDALIAATRRLMKNPDGSYQRLTEEQRQEKMEDARKIINEHCK